MIQLMNFSKDYFTPFFQNSSLSQIDGDTFAVEFAHGAQDYNGKKFVVIFTDEFVWFINNGDVILEDDVINKIFGYKKGEFSTKVTSMFGSGSTKLTVARLGALIDLYTSSPNDFRKYHLNYPSYFPINSLHDSDWNLLNGKGEDVSVIKSTLTLDEYNDEFSEIRKYLPFTPTVAFKIKRYDYQSHPIKPQWSKLNHILNMTFIDKPTFNFDLIDTTKPKPNVGSGTQLYFPILPNDKGKYATTISDLTPILDKKGKYVYFIYHAKDRNGNIVKTSKFKAYQYKYLTEDLDMIGGKNFNKVADGNVFAPYKTKPSTTFGHFFDHTGKWIFSDNHYNLGLTAVRYNYSNMIFVLEEGELPYNVVKTDGAGKEFRQEAADFHQKYLDENTSAQHTGLGKIENAKVEEIYNIQVGIKDDKSTKQQITNSINYMIGMCGVTSLTIRDVMNAESHQLTEVTEQGELDWYIGKNGTKSILIEALNTNLDYLHTRQFNWQLDSFSDEVELGILLIDGNPKTPTNQKKIKSLKNVLQKKYEIYNLKDVYVVSFDDLINGNVDNFYSLELSK